MTNIWAKGHLVRNLLSRYTEMHTHTRPTALAGPLNYHYHRFMAVIQNRLCRRHMSDRTRCTEISRRRRRTRSDTALLAIAFSS